MSCLVPDPELADVIAVQLLFFFLHRCWHFVFGKSALQQHRGVGDAIDLVRFSRR